MKDRDAARNRQEKSKKEKPPEIPEAPPPDPKPAETPTAEASSEQPKEDEVTEPAIIEIRSIRRGEVYLSEHVTGALKISKPTLELWIVEGLRFSRRGTKRRFFLGDHLIDFMFGGT